MAEERQIIFAVILSCLLLQGIKGHSHYANTTDVINSLYKNYDKRLRPYHEDRASNISVYMTVVTFSAIREIDMEFTLDLFFKQAWNDPRLKHDNPSTLLLPGGEKKNFWIPDTFFLNVKTAKFHNVPASNNRLLIKQNGDVELSERLTVAASCRMDLRDYPLDTQKCKLEILSYSYDINDIDYHWKPGEDVLVLDAEMSEFELYDYFSKRKTVKYVIGTYTHLEAFFVFRRRLAYSFIQIYSPTLLIVILSWLSFWISKDAVPARVALGITTVLTIVTLMGSLRNSVPKVSYIKAVDSYLIVSFIFVFGVLLEYIAVLMHSQHVKRKAQKKKQAAAENNCPSADFDVESASSILISTSNRSSARYSGRLSQTDMSIVSGPLGGLRSSSRRSSKAITKDQTTGENEISYQPIGYGKYPGMRHSYQKRFSKDSREFSTAGLEEEADSSYPLAEYGSPTRKPEQYGQSQWMSDHVGVSDVETDGYGPINYSPHRRPRRASKDSREMRIGTGDKDDVPRPGSNSVRGPAHQGAYTQSTGFSSSDVFINNSKPNNLKSILRRSSSQQQSVPGPAIQHSPYAGSKPTSRIWKYLPRKLFTRSSNDDVDICDKIARVMFPLTFFVFNLGYYLRYSR